MFKKRNPAGSGVENASSGHGVVTALSMASISRHAEVVKPRFDARLSFEIDRAVHGVENTCGIANQMWRIRKRALEHRIPLKDRRGGNND